MSFPTEEAIMACPKLVQIDMEYTRDLDPFALYTLVPLKDPEAVRIGIIKGEPDWEDWDDPLGRVKFLPEYDFSGKTMADLVAYHLDYLHDHPPGEAGVDYSYLFVVIHEDYEKHGILLVDLVHEHFDGTDAVPGLSRVSPLGQNGKDFKIGALSWAGNFQIGNMGWNEMEDDESSQGFPSELPGLAALQEDLQESADEQQRLAEARFDALPDRRERYSVHYVVYYDTGTTKNSVEPDRINKEMLGRSQKVASGGTGNNHRPDWTEEQHWEEIRKNHPKQCADGTTHKYWMFVYDRYMVTMEGVALVKVHWDGVTNGLSDLALEAIMPELEVVGRYPPKDALEKMDELAGFTGT